MSGRALGRSQWRPLPSFSPPLAVSAVVLLLLSLLLLCSSVSSLSSSPPRLWSVSDVQLWLSEVVGLSEYSDAFSREAIDGEVLLELTGEELQSDLHIHKLGHRKRLEKEIHKLKLRGGGGGGGGGAEAPQRKSPTPPSSAVPPSPRAPPSSVPSPPSPAGAAQFEAAAAAAAAKKSSAAGGGGRGDGGRGGGGGKAGTKGSGKGKKPPSKSRRPPQAALPAIPSLSPQNVRPHLHCNPTPPPLTSPPHLQQQPSSCTAQLTSLAPSIVLCCVVVSSGAVHLTEAEKGEVREQMRLALASHQSGELERARSVYELVLQRDPFNARALHMLGLVLMVADQDFAGAISLLERSLELSNDSDTRVNLANFHWQAGNKEEAMAQWEMALGLQVLAGGTATRHRYADTAFSMAMEVYNEGNIDQCRTFLILAIRLLTEAEMIHYPPHHNPSPFLGYNAREMKETNLELTHSIRVTLIDSWLHIGLLAEQADDVALALVAYNRALLVQPDAVDDSKPQQTRIATIRQEVQNYRSTLLARVRDLPTTPLSKARLSRAEAEADALAVDRSDGRGKKLVEFLHKTCHFAEANRLANLIVDDVIFRSPSYRFLFDNSTQIVQERQRYEGALQELLTDQAMANLWSSPMGLEWCRFRFYLAYHGLNNAQLNALLARVYLHMAPGLAYTAPHLQKGQLVQWDGLRKIRVGFISAFLTHHPVGRTVQGYVEHLPRDRFEVLVFFITLQPNVESDYLLLNMQRWADHFVRLPVERMKEARELISAHQPDVLIYADIGMEPTSFFLSFSRLAPVQALTFGHPDTSGVSTIDYFISHTNMDQPTIGQQFYTEELVALPGIGYWHKVEETLHTTPSHHRHCTPLHPLSVCAHSLLSLSAPGPLSRGGWCPQANVPGRYQTREELGLADHQLGLPTPPKAKGAPYAWTMYLVTKSIQFYSPDFMDTIAHILHQHPHSFVALLVDIGRINRGFDVHNQCQETILDGIESRLYALERGIPTSAVRSSPPVPIVERTAISGRVRFVDKGDHDYFMSLLHMTDVLLQPMPLDGTTTTLEGVTLATPTVLFEGPAIGGRMGQAIYRHMGVTANIAQSQEEYIDIAVRLGKDRDFNAGMRKEVAEKREHSRVYQDPTAITHMAEWIETAVKRNKYGQSL